EQHMPLRAIPVSILIDLVFQRPDCRKPLGRRMLCVLYFDLYLLGPGVTVQITADHLAVLGPLVEGIRRAVDPDEALSRLEPRQEVGLVGITDRQFARRVEHYRT